ncbi:MAG: methionyl-tRNA formyltransferase [Spirochaetaceae bacterium]
MRLLFAGTPAFAVPTLRLLAEDQLVAAVLTAPDKPAGRGKRLTPSPVAQEALALGIPVLKPERLGASAREAVRETGADLLVCVAYGKIFGPRFLAIFPHGGINLHPSLLPKYRGPAPIPAAILAGDTSTGLTVQYLAERMDAGDIILQDVIELDGSETTGSLTDYCAREGAVLVRRAVEAIRSGTVEARPQNEAEASYCRLLQSSDAWVDWHTSAVQIDRQIRAYDPWPGARTSFGGSWLRIHEATPLASAPVPDIDPGTRPGTVVGVDSRYGILVQTGNGILGIQRLQMAARASLIWKDFLNGVDLPVGTVLHAQEN